MEAHLARWKPSAGGFDRAAAAHLVTRAGFGASPARIDELAAHGLDAALESIWAEREPDADLMAGLEPILAGGELGSLQAWWMGLLLGGAAPLRERVALMWHDHFATSNDKVRDVRLMHAQNEHFRRAGLGDFRALFLEAAREPAMLVWLDGDDNRRGHANENFAREVLELFGLGRGNYTEGDVLELARCFTGWGTHGRDFRWRPEHHDGGEKTVFGRRGSFTGPEAIALVLEHAACAPWIARRLLVEFALPEPPPAAVAELAAILVAADWNVARALESVFTSRLFFSPAARRARIAAPVELVARSAAQLGARASALQAARAAADMGQALFRPPSVAGWDGGRAWIGAGTWIARHNWLAGLAAADAGEATGLRVDLEQSLGRPDDARGAARLAVAALIPELAGSAFERAVADGCARVDGRREALRVAAALVLTSPEYQLI
jgi:uncharacterized protein (DUF1800 family)